MTPEQAIEILSNATQPQAAGRIDRDGYATIDRALAVLKEALTPSKPETEAPLEQAL